ncbi:MULTISPECIES: dimethylarginine dimethylaminohydrolase family protein [Paraliobacillus]|uniref:dimethylarginine dimethylaminohydrolase family protein n=1 Tax=Paraliobacillus TaxID=200903 RepID=UPI000DD31C5D|nr:MULTISPECIES: arginine deiminase family protein [Paraliobacillus]
MSSRGNVMCDTEYGILEKVIVCSPAHMKIGKIINETQKHYQTENIDTKIATEQHDGFVNVLKAHDIEVIDITPQIELHEQVFTRDIGFCIGDTLITAKMGDKVRMPEVSHLEDVLREQNIVYKSFAQESIEGGDVIVDGDKVWVGISERTTFEAADALQSLLPNHQIIKLPIADRILHLDCAFNCLAPNLGIIYPKAFTEIDLQKIKEHYELIEVSDEEEFTLGTNVLSIGNKKVISLPENKLVNQQLRDLGYEVIEVEFNEIIKSGGSFRCCSLPLVRK